MLESEVENHLDWAVQVAGGRTWKFKSPSNRGVSDRIVCLPNGQTWFVECKRPKGGRVAPLQAAFADTLLALNQRYLCVWTKEQVDQWLRCI